MGVILSQTLMGQLLPQKTSKLRLAQQQKYILRKHRTMLAGQDSDVWLGSTRNDVMGVLYGCCFYKLSFCLCSSQKT